MSFIASTFESNIVGLEDGEFNGSTSEVNNVFRALEENDLNEYPSINSAYETLLSGRVNDTILSEINDEAKLCNLNLKTAITFKTLNEKHVTLNSRLRILNQDSENNLDILNSTHKNMRTMEILCKKYTSDSLEKLKKNNEMLQQEFLANKLRIETEIEKEKIKVETEIDFMKMKLNSLRSLIVSGISEMVNKDDANNKKLCPVCFDREVNMAMVPCGHTCCQGCSDYNTTTKCMQCRSIIQRRIKLFFSV